MSAARAAVAPAPRPSKRRGRHRPGRRHDHHELPPDWDAMSLGALWDTLNDPQRHGVAKSTLLAAGYLISTGDMQRWRQWFDSRTAKERKAILEHLEKRVSGGANE